MTALPAGSPARGWSGAPDGEGEAEAATGRQRFASWAVVAAGAALFFFRLGAKSVWLDEATSFRYVSSTWGDLWAALWRDSNMSLYYVLLRVWVRLGTSEAWLRAPSAAFAALALFPAFGLARRLIGARGAAVFALLLAANTAFVGAAQEARGYSLLVLLLLLGAWALVRGALGEGRGWWTVAAVALGLAAYAHFYTAFTLLAFGLWLLAARRDVDRAGILPALLVLALLLAPIALRFAAGGPKQDLRWLPAPDLALAWEAIGHLGGAGRTAPVFFAVVVALAVAGAARPEPGTGGPPASVRRLPAIWLVTGVAAPFLVSLVGPHVFHARYLVTVVPPLLLLAAGTASRLQGRAAAAVGTVLVALALVSLRSYYFHSPKHDWRSATALALQRFAPGDVAIVQAAHLQDALDYYQRDRASPSLLPVPHLGPRNYARHVDPGQIEALAGRAPGLWLFLDSACGPHLAQQGDELLEIVGRSYRLVEALPFDGMLLLRYRSRSSRDAGAEPELPAPELCD